jgi:hypothetical protein
MKKTFLSIIIFLVSTTNIFSHVDHYSDFRYLEYELFRNNKLIGYHKYNFERLKNELTVSSDVKFKISKLGVDLYNYEAKSEEKYKDSNFFQFSSSTNQNKKIKYVNIVYNKEKDNLTIDGSSFKGESPKDFIVGTWWNHEIIKAKAQISAISGRIIQQKVEFLGKEKIDINGTTYNTLHFNFSSSDKSLPDSKKLNTDIWYEEESFLWIKAAFDKSGHWEYRIKEAK